MIKDLGPQVSWRTVFLVEYFGPLIIHSIIFHLPFLFYPGIPPRPKSLVQTLAFYMVVIHYAKREFESVFIHRFSSATMPLRNIFKNSFHYWFLGGAFIAYFIYHPRFTSFVSDEVAVVLFILMLLCMLGNLITHIILMNLRPAGTTKRAIPKGFLFNYVSCPNYFLEITEWVLFALMTQSISSAIFAIVSAGQMWIWAVQKHRRYKKEFSGKDDTEKYPPRKILIPFLL